MKKYFNEGIIFGLVCVAMLTAGLGNQIVAADDGEQPALQADQSMLSALQKSDKAAAGKLLDADFVWTDTSGKSMKKADVLNALSPFATDNTGDEKVQTHFYTQVETVIGEHHNARFLRIWVKRPEGWREFIELDTPIANRAAPGSMVPGQGDCENPCRTVPFKPETAMDKAILADWQKTKVDEWHPNATDWPLHIADEFLIINNASMRDKADRVALAKKQEQAGVGTVGDPITAMEIHDFGDNAAVMISHHTPHRGGKPYYNVRVWTLRDGRWQLAVSQQTSIESAAEVPPANSK